MRIPLWLKIGWTIWLIVWAPVYLRHYEAQNFLYFCDIGNVLIGIGLWTESPLIFSWAACGLLLFPSRHRIGRRAVHPSSRHRRDWILCSTRTLALSVALARPASPRDSRHCCYGPFRASATIHADGNFERLPVGSSYESILLASRARDCGLGTWSLLPRAARDSGLGLPSSSTSAVVRSALSSQHTLVAVTW